jgi:hypothetical protein
MMLKSKMRILLIVLWSTLCLIGWNWSAYLQTHGALENPMIWTKMWEIFGESVICLLFAIWNYRKRYKPFK